LIQAVAFLLFLVQGSHPHGQIEIKSIIYRIFIGSAEVHFMEKKKDRKEKLSEADSVLVTLIDDPRIDT